MTEMVERVARSMAREAGKELGVPGVNLYVEDQWRNYVFTARAAIEAMREPTKGMQDAGLVELGKGINRDLEILAIWDTMIDAALAPKP